MLECANMRQGTLFLMAALAGFPLYAENSPQAAPSLQQLADSMELAQPAARDTQLSLPGVPGAEVTLLGCDYEQLVSRKGRILRDILSDTPVRVSFTVKRGEEAVTSRDYEIILPATGAHTGGNAKPKVIPDLLQWQGGEVHYELGDTISCNAFHHPKGPHPHILSLLRADVKALFGKEMNIRAGNTKGSIHLELSNPKEGNNKSEDYELIITPERVTIKADGPTGLYWGTRTLLQMLRQGNGSAPCGKAYDAPRYPVRGFMLDVGRLPVPMAELKNIIRTMAWYKMNDLQLHLNDNYIFHEHYVDAGEDPFRRSYSGFRMESGVRGADGTPLTAQDHSYSKDDFKKLVSYARQHGVNIVPEFDTPGHALSFTRVRPELIYQGPMSRPKRRCEMLDAANPKALKFACDVWDEYLGKGKTHRANMNSPFGGCKVVHVGSDEFFGDKEDYRAYADGILRHVLSRGYTPRIWGSLHAKQGKTPVIAEGVQMNLWSGDWAKAWDSIAQGYDIINTDDGRLYIVPFADYYRMDKNHRWVYEHWKLNNIHGQTVPSGHPRLLGGMFAVWNDMSDRLHNGYMIYDYWGALRASLGVLGERMWGQATPPRSFDEHCALADAIHSAPNTDALHRRGAEDKAVSLTPGTLPLPLGKGSLGPAWHLTAELTLNAAPEGEEQVLLDSPEGQLLAVGKDGCVGFRRADTMWFSFDGAKLPVGERVTLELIGKPGSTQLFINGRPAGTLTLRTHHNRTEGLLSTFILPLETLGRNLHGTVHHLEITPSE